MSDFRLYAGKPTEEEATQRSGRHIRCSCTCYPEQDESLAVLTAAARGTSVREGPDLDTVSGGRLFDPPPPQTQTIASRGSLKDTDTGIFSVPIGSKIMRFWTKLDLTIYGDACLGTALESGGRDASNQCVDCCPQIELLFVLRNTGQGRYSRASGLACVLRDIQGQDVTTANSNFSRCFGFF